jgi:hypothetical protein
MTAWPNEVTATDAARPSCLHAKPQWRGTGEFFGSARNPI